MRDYRLYHYYVLEYGLTFLPKGQSDAGWEVATELMMRALHREGPPVSQELINQSMTEPSFHMVLKDVA